MKAYFAPRDITIISAARLCKEDSCLSRKGLVDLHLKIMRETCNYLDCKFVFVDHGSDNPIEPVNDPHFTWIREDVNFWDESRAKNIALDRVETDLVAFTNADMLIYPETIQMTLEVIGNPDHFILQGYRWEVPRDITRQILNGNDAWRDRHIIQNLSVPHAGPKLAMGDWQVAYTKDVRSIGGYDERMKGYGGMDTDLHDRMYALTGHDIHTREIPALHLYHYAERPLSPNHALRRETIKQFIKSGSKKDLDWRNSLKSSGKASADKSAA